MASNSPLSVFFSSALPQSIKNYLELARHEALTAHPASAPQPLICPISLQLMTEPVYTPTGYVYDKKNILKALATNPTDPQNRAPLKPSNLKPLPGLLDAIKIFTERQTSYLEIKKQLISQASDLAYANPPSANPALFLCPISKKRIKEPVLTAAGKIYDKQALKQYLHETGNLDETGCRLTMADVIDFPEFQEKMKRHAFYLTQASKTGIDVDEVSSVSNTNCVYGFFNALINNIFSSTKQEDNSKGLVF
ncbi:U-box domain-containing protein [Legionella sp. 29fVS95]|uniref:U-box domain-containing protein n=1 Tax=Legionella sp. 29fVS95 TaxID=3402813 RepID=UPI003AF97238